MKIGGIQANRTLKMFCRWEWEICRNGIKADAQLATVHQLPSEKRGMTGLCTIVGLKPANSRT